MLFISRILIVMIILMINVTNLHAQIPKEALNIQSPNAMSYGLYGEVPVSYYSGVPSIQVPLHTFKENQISIPITLSYHASGFRPDVHPGWVGMNWNLSVGAITRTIRTRRDDYRHTSDGREWNRGYYYTHDVNNGPNWETVGFLDTTATNYYNSVADAEPDEFSFNFPGYSGKFYLDHLGNWKVSCDRPVKVSFDGSMIPTVINDIPPMLGVLHYSGFTITDEFGNKYVFGIDPNAIEFCSSFFIGAVDWSAQAWYLTKIIHADGYEVRLKYERDHLINQMYNARTFNDNTYQVNEGAGWLSRDCAGNNEFLPYNQSFSGKLISPVYLSSIEGSTQILRFKRSNSVELKYSITPNDYRNPYHYREDQAGQIHPIPAIAQYIQGKIEDPNFVWEFYPSLDTIKFKQLDTLEVLNVSGEILKTFKFYYTANTAKRLALDSLREIGQNGLQKPCYKFAYKPYGSSEPLYLENKNDHFGFYNGTLGNSDDDLTYYNQRDSNNATFAQYGAIDSIIYPTGGVTKFYFESHTYSKRLLEFGARGIDNYFSSNTSTGGLRIKKIESYDKTTPNTKTTKEYFYIRNYTNSSNPGSDPSSGVLSHRIKYSYNQYTLPVLGYPSNKYRLIVYSSQGVIPASENSAGAHVTYSEVVEKKSDGSYTKYYYNNYDNGHLDDSAIVLQDRTPYEQVSSKSVERGTLQKQEEYSNTDVLLKSKVIDYIALNKNNEYVRAIDAMITPVCKGMGVNAYKGTLYKIYTYSYLPKSEIITEYSQGGGQSLITKKYFFYNETTRLIIKDSTITSKGQPLCNYYYYPADVLNYSPLANVPITQPVAYMQQKNMIGNVLQSISTRKNGASEEITAMNVTVFKNFGNLIKPYRQYSFSQPATKVIKSASHLYRVGFSGGNETEALPTNTELITNFTKYDHRGNVTTFAKDQDINTALLWRNNFHFPVAKVINAYNNLEYGFNYAPKQLSIARPQNYNSKSIAFTHYTSGDIEVSFDWDVSPSGTAPRVYLLIVGIYPYIEEFYLTAGTSRTLTNFPAGFYSCFIKDDASTSILPATIKITYNGGVSSYQTTTNTQAQFFYEGFEESLPSGIKPFAGSNCIKGDYTVPYVVPAGGTYLIDYHYLDNGTWEYIKKYYSNNMTITEGDAIDEVRVYRTDAQITTYTYDVDKGVTSISDINGKTENYIYDGLGRLVTVKDDNGNILKRICYTYYGQTQNCSIDTSAVWKFTNDTRCKPCAFDPDYLLNIKQKLKRNNNPNSATYNDTMWVDDGISADCNMTIPGSWIDTGAPLTCQKNEINNNTGYRLRKEIDTFKCSYTYNYYREVPHDYNTTSCPINMGTIKFTAVGGAPGGYVTFTGTAGTFTFYFPNYTVTGHTLGTLPGGIYDVYINTGGVSRTVLVNGSMAFSGIADTAYDILVGGPNWTISMN